jgi:hypothetical protein
MTLNGMRRISHQTIASRGSFITHHLTRLFLVVQPVTAAAGFPVSKFAPTHPTQPTYPTQPTVLSYFLSASAKLPPK